MDKYNTFWSRFFAGLLDGFILVPVGVIAFAFLYLSDSLGVAIGAMIFNNVAAFFYSIYFHGTTGQTPGKKMMNIRVVHKDEARTLTFWEAIRRDSIYIILETFAMSYIIIESIHYGEYTESYGAELVLDYVALMWFLLEVVTMLTNERRRAVHDFLADSVVIKDDAWSKNLPVRD